jgi:hypothetical protein
MHPLFYLCKNRISNIEQGIMNCEGVQIENFSIRNSLLDIRYSIATEPLNPEPLNLGTSEK